MSSTDEVVTDYQSGRWVAKRRTVIRLAPKVMAPCIQKKGDPPLCRRPVDFAEIKMTMRHPHIMSPSRGAIHSVASSRQNTRPLDRLRAR